MAIIEETRLIMTDAGSNNNKYWHGELHDDGTVHSKWGRVGYGNKSQEKTWTGAGAAFFRKKKSEKLAKGYVEQRTVANSQAQGSSSRSGRSISTAALKSQAVKDIGKNSAVAKLISWLADINVHAILANTQNMTYNEASGTFSTPLGLVTQDGLVEARSILNDLAKMVNKRDTGRRFSTLAGDLMAIIPQNVGMKSGWDQRFFGSNDLLAKQYDLLDALDASLATAATVKPKKADVKDDGKRVFEVELDIVTDDKVVRSVKRKYNADKGNHYDVRTLDVKQVWTITLPSMSKAFEAKGKQLGNIMQLWHGTKASNLLSILKVGLIIPPSSSGHCTGRMFSNGLYFSDQSTKAIRYATGGWGYGGDTSRTFMFLADVAMGKHYTPSGPTSSPPPRGYDSYFAKANKSGVMNNEMIVPNTHQCNLVYLCEFSNGGR